MTLTSTQYSGRPFRDYYLATKKWYLTFCVTRNATGFGFHADITFVARQWHKPCFKLDIHVWEYKAYLEIGARA